MISLALLICSESHFRGDLYDSINSIVIRFNHPTNTIRSPIPFNIGIIFSNIENISGDLENFEVIKKFKLKTNEAFSFITQKCKALQSRIKVRLNHNTS
jgi:hypothetical protein